jgi:hypothetical protein
MSRANEDVLKKGRATFERLGFEGSDLTKSLV